MQDRVIHSKKIDWKQIQTLQPDNFKVPEQQEVLKKSLLANGFVSPFCVWEDEAGVIWSIDGVHRIKALTELQQQGQDIPELLTANFIEAKDRKEAGIILLEVFNSKQNKATEQGLELLKIDLDISNDDLHLDFEDLDIKIELEDPEITELETAEAPDEAPEPPAIPITAKGDLYELNGHRVLCGDSTVINDIDRLMQGEKADLVFTDPPYSMHLDTDFSSMKNEFKGKQQGNTYSKVIGDNDDFTPELINTIFANFDYCKEIFIWGSDYFAELLPEKNKGSWIVWDKRLTDEAGKMYGSEFELCWSKSKHKRKIFRVKWAGIFGTETQDIKHRVHPTQKPLELILLFLQEWSKENCLVVDLFAGSGSTLIACEQAKRKNYSIELEPKYCDVIVTRWVKMMKENNKEYVVKRNGEIIDWEI